MLPSVGEYLVVRQEGDSPPKLVKESLAIPAPKEKELIVKVQYAAQNPTDVQSFDSNAFGDGAVLGCDFVGVVEASGRGAGRDIVSKTVAGLIWGGEIKGAGAYSQYTLADEDISFEVPEGITLEQASTVPLAATTAWLAFFSKDCLGIDRDSKPAVLVWGGSSSVGNYAIQIGKLQGFTVVTTCSPKHNDLVRSLGADHIFDYHDEKVVDKIKEAVPDLKYVFDTIGGSTTSVTASKALASGGALCTVRPDKANTEGVVKGTKVTPVLVWTAFLKKHRYGKLEWPESKADHELSKELYKKLPGWLREKKILPNNTKLYDGGLDDVEKGFQEYRDGKISAYKIVYKVHEVNM